MMYLIQLSMTKIFSFTRKILKVYESVDQMSS